MSIRQEGLEQEAKTYRADRKIGLESEQIQHKTSVEPALDVLKKVKKERRKAKMQNPLIDTLL